MSPCDASPNIRRYSDTSHPHKSYSVCEHAGCDGLRKNLLRSGCGPSANRDGYSYVDCSPENIFHGFMRCLSKSGMRVNGVDYIGNSALERNGGHTFGNHFSHHVAYHMNPEDLAVFGIRHDL